MGPVRGTKGVIHINIAQGGQLSSKIFLLFGHRRLSPCRLPRIGTLGQFDFAFFSRMEPQILKQQNLPGLQCFGQCLDRRANAIRRHRHRTIQQAGQMFRHRCQTEGDIRLPFRAPQVAHQNGRTPSIQDMLNRRQCGTNPRVVVDDAICQGHIEVDAHEGSLTVKGKIT